MQMRKKQKTGSAVISPAASTRSKVRGHSLPTTNMRRFFCCLHRPHNCSLHGGRMLFLAAVSLLFSAALHPCVHGCSSRARATGVRA
jgi:hypothetical protein